MLNIDARHNPKQVNEVLRRGLSSGNDIDIVIAASEILVADFRAFMASKGYTKEAGGFGDCEMAKVLKCSEREAGIISSHFNSVLKKVAEFESK